MIDYPAVIGLVQSAKQVILHKYTEKEITMKGPSDFVTQIDMEVQEHLKAGLSLMYPQIQFMGEEQSNCLIDFTRPVWIVDPIDGTTNLIHDYGHSAVSLALYDGEKLAFGVIYNPFRDEIFHAVAGQGAYLNGEQISVSKVETLADSLIIVGTSAYNKDTVYTDFGLYQRIFMKCMDLRRLGAASLDLAYVACGRSPGYLEKNLKPWDIAAGVLLVREAGGVVTTYEGEEIFIVKNSDIVASNGRIHDELLEEIAFVSE